MAKENKILAEMLRVLKDMLGVNKEHKNISKEIKKDSMKKNEQRFWYIFTIVIMILIGGGIILSLSSKEISNNVLKIDVSPGKIKLNEKRDINFKVNFTNVGGQNISGFDIFKVDLYRIEDGKRIYHRQIIIPGDNRNYKLNCHYFYPNERELSVGKTCTAEFKMYACSECFDDKDKQVQLLIYLDSVPPIKNRIVNLSIY